jgi:hypothetical protein
MRILFLPFSGRMIFGVAIVLNVRKLEVGYNFAARVAYYDEAGLLMNP